MVRVSKQELHTTLIFSLATGKVGLNEIALRLKELRDPLMLKILEQILMSYVGIISQRLSQTNIYPNKARKALGWHVRKGDPKSDFVVAAKYENGFIVAKKDAFPLHLGVFLKKWIIEIQKPDTNYIFS